MSDSILQRYKHRHGDDSESGNVVELETAEHCGAFGFLRGIRDSAKMLQLRKRSGEILGVGYGYLEKAEYDPGTGITLHAVGQKLVIKGRNLNTEVRPTVRLFEAITRHRVTYIAESDESSELFAANEVVVDAIEW